MKLDIQPIELRFSSSWPDKPYVKATLKFVIEHNGTRSAQFREVKGSGLTATEAVRNCCESLLADLDRAQGAIETQRDHALAAIDPTGEGI